MSQSSPTPDPVAWMVVDKDGDDVDVHRDSEVAEASRIGWDDERPQYSPYRVVPLFRQPSALPATTPSGLFTKDDLEILWAAYRSAKLGGAEREAKAINSLRERVGRCIANDRWPVSPSEGSAPDTPTLADHIAREMMWKGHGCGLYSDDGEMRCQCPVDWKRDSLPALHEHFRAKQLARALAPVPLSAPDTKPDETAAFEAWFIENYPPGCIIGEPAWHAPRILRAARRVSSSPPEGEDTQRLDWLESLVVDAAGKRFNIVDPLERGMLQIETWGSMDLRDLIDSARAAIPPQNTGHE